VIDVNVTVRFIGRASSTISAGDLLSVSGVQGGTPRVEPSAQGLCFASNDADISREVMCLGFGHITTSSAAPIQRPLTLNHSDAVNEILPRLNVSDINTPLSSVTRSFTGEVLAGQALAFEGATLALSAGLWTVVYLIEDTTETHSADIYINGVLADHTPEISGVSPTLRASAALVESDGRAEISLISRHTATYQNARCTVYQISDS
jgi:hypothetical protein